MADQENNSEEFADTQTRKTIKLKLPTQNPVAKMNLEKTDTQMVDPLSSRDTDTGNLDILNNTQTRKTIKLKPMSPRNIDVNDGSNTNSRKVVVIKPNPAKPTIAESPKAAPPSAPTIKLDATPAEEEVNDDTIAVAKIAPPKATTAFKPPVRPTIPLSSSPIAKAPKAEAPVAESPVEELSEDDTIAVAKVAPPKPVIAKPQFAKPATTAPVAPIAPEAEASDEDDRTVKIAKPKKLVPPVADNVTNEEDKATVKLKKRPPVAAPPTVAKPIAPPVAAPVAPPTEETPAIPPVMKSMAPEIDSETEMNENGNDGPSIGIIHAPSEAQPSKFYMAMAIASLILLAGSAALSGYQYYEVFMPK